MWMLSNLSKPGLCTLFSAVRGRIDPANMTGVPALNVATREAIVVRRRPRSAIVIVTTALFPEGSTAGGPTPRIRSVSLDCFWEYQHFCNIQQTVLTGNVRTLLLLYYYILITKKKIAIGYSQFSMYYFLLRLCTMRCHLDS